MEIHRGVFGTRVTWTVGRWSRWILEAKITTVKIGRLVRIRAVRSRVLLLMDFDLQREVSH